MQGIRTLCESLVDFLPMDRHVHRGIETQPYSVALDFQDSDRDAVTDDNRFPTLPGQNQHVVLLHEQEPNPVVNGLPGQGNLRGSPPSLHLSYHEHGYRRVSSTPVDMGKIGDTGTAPGRQECEIEPVADSVVVENRPWDGTERITSMHRLGYC
jgi:hypothetical protein